MAIKKVELKPFLSTHKDFLLNAYNQNTIIDTGFITYDYPISDIKVEAIINNWLNDSDYYKCFIIENNNKPIGTAQITSINYINRTCEIGVLIVEEYQGQGGSLSAGLQLLKIAFDNLDFYKVAMRVKSTNPISMKGAEMLGFRLEGTLKEQVRDKGGRADLHYYGLTQTDYKNHNYSKYQRLF